MKNIRDIIFDKCVYTIVNINVIEQSQNNEDLAGSFIEKKSWTKAAVLANLALQEDKIFPLLLADAAYIDGVFVIAQIDEIEILADGGTKIFFSGAHYLKELQPLSKLRLLSSGEFLSDRYIRPYALCYTPEFTYEDGERIFSDYEAIHQEYVAKFKKALQQIESKISSGQRKMLIGHYAAPDMKLSVTKLAELAGYKGASNGKLHYGKLAGVIASALDETPPTQDNISTIAQWSDDKDDRGHGQWILYDEVAQALEELGWVAKGAAAEEAPLNPTKQALPDATSIIQSEELSETSYKAWVEARIGQQRFREKLLQYWNGCSVTGCSFQEALVASHIVPWSKSSNKERLDVFNGLLLTPNLDRLFDNHLISFNQHGEMLISKSIPSEARVQLGIDQTKNLRRIDAEHLCYMQQHEEEFREKEKAR